ncbi:response regulator [Polyangium aurulentum]|uniref:response regulator n=1 Tax=Polyangium aurulentum TaxID=2567896 RepID=UPI0010AE9F18|nr:response regulator [Polyangium aurulentum]UQA62069.1 response regulator [Polyangium aurulentum]
MACGEIADDGAWAQAMSAQHGTTTRRGRVLLVDDEPFIGSSLRRLLGAENDVVAVSSGHEALERIAAGERFDVILCDLRMPAMSGMELYDQLHAMSPEMAERMVFFTGAAFTGDIHAFFSRVRNELLEKPFDPSALKALVRRLVDRGGSR